MSSPRARITDPLGYARPFEVLAAAGTCILQAAGFEVLAYDADDSMKVRELGHLLEWDVEGEDLQKTLFATYTLLRRPL